MFAGCPDRQTPADMRLCRAHYHKRLILSCLPTRLAFPFDRINLRSSVTRPIVAHKNPCAQDKRHTAAVARDVPLVRYIAMIGTSAHFKTFRAKAWRRPEHALAMDLAGATAAGRGQRATGDDFYWQETGADDMYWYYDC
eukprot:scaffold239374_cov21-Prasinocladus_malaysianus.AAC.2